MIKGVAKSASVIAAVAVLIPPQALAGDAARDAALRAYLQRTLGPASLTPNTSIKTAWTDLNRDGRPEAVVYVSGPERCGSGGCDLLILEATATGFRARGDLSVARLPVGVVEASTDGWRHITVGVGGGGIINGYTAEVPFTRGKYASNPTVPPAHRLKADAIPKIVLTAEEKSEPLFDRLRQ